MLFKTLAPALVLWAWPLLSSALPANTPSGGVVAAKAHNIYLVTCTPKNRKDDDDKSTTNFTAVAYFKTPLNATDSSANPTTLADSDKAPKPDKAALVAQPPEAWEGVKWKIKVWKDKLFTIDIGTEAKVSVKGALAGDAQLDTESYVCFKDGDTAIRIREDTPLRGNCVADYWCAGLGKPTDDGN